MKTFRLIVSLRLALFPLIFNLSFAQEDANNNLGSVSMTDRDWNREQNKNEVEPGLNWDEVHQNDEHDAQESHPTPLLIGEGNHEVVGEVDKQDIQDSSLDAQNYNLQPVDSSPSVQNDGQDIQESPLISELQINTQNFLPNSPLLKISEIEDWYTPNLKITEVYRLSNDEWIEITNISDKDFSWKINLSWVKSSEYKKTVNIPAYSSIILSDKSDIGLIDDSILAVNASNSTFNIVDSNGIWISLIYSWVEIDTFNVDQSIVINNQVPASKLRPSFQKVYNGNRDNIQITTIWDIYNISWFVANPWKVIIESWNPWIGDWPLNPEDPLNINENWNSDEPWNWENPWSWDVTWWSSDFKLILSEVYYDDDDERIEIYNIGTWEFFGDIELSWAIFPNNKTNHNYKNIQIPANDFLIIADSDEMFGFSWDVNMILNGQTFPEFSIPDDQEIQISLIFSWQEIDNFFVHESRVEDRDDYAESFHKIMFDEWPIISYASTHYGEENNMSENTYKLGNPWILYTSADFVKDCSKEKSDNSQTQEDETGCWDVWEDMVTISEIFRWWSRYDPYVEFSIHEDLRRYYDSLLLSWSLLNQPITMDLTEETETFDKRKLQKNTKLILTTKPWALTEAGLITIILQSTLEFNSFSWELELYWIDGQSRQLLDIVKITTWAYEKSTYYSHLEHECWITMDNVNNFSPGFEESALKYFSTTSSYNEKIVEKVKYVWWGGGCSCPSKAELCWTWTENVVQTGDVQEPPFDKGGAEWNEAEGFNTWDTQEIPPLSPLAEGGQETPKGAQIKIVSLEPKNPESITLQSFLPYDIDFKNHNYFLKTSTSDSKKYIDWILYANTIDTFFKTFWFVDAWACVYLYSWNSTLDSYCYSSNKPEKQQKEEKTDSFTPSDYQISISYIDYDPEWSDSWNESITIKSNSSKSLDLSKIKMKVNATNKKLSWILEPNSSITLTWSFWFPNSTKDGSDVVVILFYDNYIFSTYTYNPNKPKVEIPDWAVKVYSVIDGDTFRYRKEDWSLQSVRLLGVDAPESNIARYRSTECFWKEAKNYLTNLIKNQYVTLEFDPNSASSDAYGRMLAYVYLDWKMVNETLIAEWYAKEYTYKTDYTHQLSFRQAEENARKSEKWLRSSATCGKSIEEEPEAWGIDYEKLSIKISNVIYDPDGTDSWNEIVELNVDNSQISTVTSIDFSDDFSLTIFPRSEYATWTTKNKKLTEFWLFNLSTSSNITLKWNLWLPNNRATCVSLNQWNYTFDTRCYNPNQSLSDEETPSLWDTLTSIPNVKIQSIIPNPSGKDSWKEEITLLRTPSEEYADLLNLSPDFSLLINDKTKKKLVWNLVPNQKITIKWSFSFPNSASCVSLLYKWEEIDKFCYSKASDWVKFNSNNTSVNEISAEELAIVKKITLVKNGDKLCISYNKTQFSCKSIPNSTTEKNKKQLSMQNTFITELEKYIKSNYSTIYYNSEIRDYFNLHSEVKKAIKSWSGDFTRNDSNISVTNISSLFPTEYDQDARDYFVGLLQWALPEGISLSLLQAEDEYNKKQVEKSDLGFLSMVN